VAEQRHAGGVEEDEVFSRKPARTVVEDLHEIPPGLLILPTGFDGKQEHGIIDTEGDLRARDHDAFLAQGPGTSGLGGHLDRRLKNDRRGATIGSNNPCGVERSAFG